MGRIAQKQFLLTGFLEYLIKKYFPLTKKDDLEVNAQNKTKVTVEIVTPSNVKERGSQLSLIFSTDLKEVHSKFEQMGVVV